MLLIGQLGDRSNWDDFFLIASRGCRERNPERNNASEVGHHMLDGINPAPSRTYERL